MAQSGSFSLLHCSLDQAAQMGYIMILSLLVMGSLVNQIQAQSIIIETQPQDQNTEIDQNVTFTLHAIVNTSDANAPSVNFTFQWLKNEVMISDTLGKYSGIDTQSLTVFFVNVSDEGGYSCYVSSAMYGSLLSREAVLRVVRDCEMLPNITNGVVTAHNVTLGSIATYTCSANYSLNGTANRTCEANGNWTQSAPNCIIRCEMLPNITNGVVTAPNLTLGSIATYNCSANYSLNGTAVRTCEADGNWTQSAPNCIKNTAWKMVASGLLVTVIALASILVSLS